MISAGDAGASGSQEAALEALRRCAADTATAVRSGLFNDDHGWAVQVATIAAVAGCDLASFAAAVAVSPVGAASGLRNELSGAVLRVASAREVAETSPQFTTDYLQASGRLLALLGSINLIDEESDLRPPADGQPG